MEKQIPKQAVKYLLCPLAGMPQTITALLRDVTVEELDARPFADRFTLREAIAHLADWEGVWLGRIQKIATEESPFLPGYDEGQWAIDHDYAHSNFEEQMAKIVSGREAMVNFLLGLEMPAWQRLGNHGELGPVSLFELAVVITGHDGYHVQQILDYRGLKGAGGH
ncbi:MAG: DinB family protein [Armatimonadota bacterium]